MAFDTETRNKLSRMVADARTLLRDEFTRQLQEIYGIQPDGKITEIEKLTHLDDEQRDVANLLRERVEHLAIGMGKEKNPIISAIDRMTREQSFTVLNRFAALRMCEERGLIQQCVGNGMESEGFEVYLQIAGSSTGDRYERYCVFLFCVFDEIAVDLGILFDRFSPFGLLFPRESALGGLLQLLNKEELKFVWSEDVVIGWIFQFFNSEEDNKKAKYTAAGKPKPPQNSRELAIRNQFFTPRYVVEFLSDNTLGRIWYEMCAGETTLKHECRYLARNPNEIFLKFGETAPVVKGSEDECPQEELIKKPFYIKHRPKKDPRDFLVLDPACGSGHFLLYTFDLLELIYQEAWNDSESPKSEATGCTLREDFENIDSLRRSIPKLVVENNLHGVDIDPRAVQIASLALWLRAQRTWGKQGLKAPDRPKIDRSNIVVAKPMPGDVDMRKEFTAGLKPRILGQVLDDVFEKMKLAGEAGPLLRIEEHIRATVAIAKKQWQTIPKPEQAFLFPIGNRPKQQEFRFDFNGVDNIEFWGRAESLILNSLKDYAELAENSHKVRKRMFVADSGKGFAFIDLCQKRFDVILMNPPFGDSSFSTRELVSKGYPLGKGDLGCCFVTRASEMMENGGRFGVLMTRTPYFLSSYAKWRKKFVLRVGGLELFADFGLGVLDATVETCACVYEPSMGNL